MLDFSQSFEKFNRDLTAAIIQNPAFQKAKASGRAEAFLRSENSAKVTPLRFTKTGLYPTAIDKGYRGKVEVSDIYDWLGFKKYGINYSNNKERFFLAKRMAARIKRIGTLKYRENSKKTDIFGQAIAETLPSLFDDLRNDMKDDLRTYIRKRI